MQKSTKPWHKVSVPAVVWKPAQMYAVQTLGKEFKSWYVGSKGVWGSNHGRWKKHGSYFCFRDPTFAKQVEEMIVIWILSIQSRT